MVVQSLLRIATTLGVFHLAITTTALGQRNVESDFVGRGAIHVLNTTNLTTASPSDRIGCLNAHGMLTANDCAVFTRLDDLPHALYSEAGNCSFRNPDMPTNTDSVYGRNTHAWSCGGKREDNVVEYYYTMNGFKYPLVCNGNLNCWYDIYAKLPTDDSEPLPVWAFYWGSHQADVPNGHWRVLWLWVQVPGGSSDPGQA
ncbi:hypothetical protein VTI74DRAFT_9172 [Chaetomium olivicolor]